MSTHGGKRPGAGRKPTTGRSRDLGGVAVYVMLSQSEAGEVKDVLNDDETAAGLARAMLLREARRRSRRNPNPGDE